MMRADQQISAGSSASRIRGFTIVELLIAMAIVGLVLGAIYAVFTSSNRSYHTQDRVVDTQQGLRVGLDFMVRDIRLAGLDPIETDDFAIEEATTTSIQFTADLNMDGDVDEDSRERIAYFLDGTGLQRCNLDTQYVDNGSPPPDRVPDADEDKWDTLIDNVSNLRFEYFDADGICLDGVATEVDPECVDTPFTVPADKLAEIRTVVLTMTTQGTDVEGKTFDRTMSSRVRCRNL